LLMRLLCSQARVDAHKMRTGSLWQDDTKKVVRAMEQLAHAPIFIDDTPGISLSEMRAKARRLKQAQGGKLDLIIVDYLQLMSGGGKRFENRTQEVSAISRGLKALAKEPEARYQSCREMLEDLRNYRSIAPGGSPDKTMVAGGAGMPNATLPIGGTGMGAQGGRSFHAGANPTEGGLATGEKIIALFNGISVSSYWRVSAVRMDAS